MTLPVRQVHFESANARGSQNQALATVGATVAATVGPGVGAAVGNGHEPDSSTSGFLNPKFTFDSFVVGNCNQFAHAAAQSVASHPSRSYNPLFLYGGVGMGKTHLMHAIGRELIDRYGSMRVIYTSSERFMNEMIACIRKERMQQF